MSDAVYLSDPDRPPDSDFRPGQVAHLVAGNRGRLLDLRRTPVHVTRVMPGIGFFEVEIDDFEDAGARWLVPLEEVTSYQFTAGSSTAGDAAIDELRAAIARCDVQVTVTAGEVAKQHARNRLEADCARAAAWLTSAGAPASFDPLPFIEEASGWPAAARWLESYLAERGVADLEESFAPAYVSNPWAGDWVLAHLIVMAELGLGTFSARAIRDQGCFQGAWTRRRRAEHIVARTGFTRALWARAGGAVTLYRGVGLAAGATSRDRSRRGTLPLLSASFSCRVAESHYSSAGAAAGALYRQPLQPARLFMTFLETNAMTRQYQESEAILVTGPGPFF